MAQIDVTKDELRELVQKHILDSLSPEKRDQIMKEAVAYLLNEKAGKNPYSPTTLQELLRDAVSWAARDILKELVQEGTPVHAQIRDAASKALSAYVSSEEFHDKLGNVFNRVFDFR